MISVPEISFFSSSYELIHIISIFLLIKASAEVFYGAPFKSIFNLY